MKSKLFLVMLGFYGDYKIIMNNLIKMIFEEMVLIDLKRFK